MAASSKCSVCSKMVSSCGTLISDPKSNHVAVKPILPGLNTTSTVKKASDNNLSPFLTSKSELLQYGDTSVESICTDNLMSSDIWRYFTHTVTIAIDSRHSRQKKNTCVSQLLKYRHTYFLHFQLN